MIRVYYEYVSEQNNVFHTATCEKNKIQVANIHHTLSDLVKNTLEKKSDMHYFLLHEERFFFFRFDISHTSKQPVRLRDINEIITRKVKELKRSHGANGTLLHTFMDSICVDGLEKKHLIGEQGEIFFRLYFVFVRPKTLHFFNKFYGDISNQHHIKLYPQSLETVLYLRKQIQRDDFLILYIHDTICKAVHIKRGFFNRIEIINMGLNSLKKMYKDAGISKYWYQSPEMISSNELAKQLIEETLEFYCNMLVKWIKEHEMLSKDVVLISPIMKNGFFMEIFNACYGKETNGFIVPFHHGNDINVFGQKREPQDSDILVTINHTKEIKDHIN